MKKKYFYTLIFALLFILNSSGQIVPPPASIPAPPGLPINGGVLFLLISGIWYAVKKIKQQ